MSLFLANLQVDQGADFTAVTFAWGAGSPVDISGYSGVMKLRWTPSDTTAVLAITTTPNASGSVLTLGSNGTVTIFIARADTLALPITPPVGAPPYLSYEIDVTSPASPGPVRTTRFQQGRFYLSPTVNA